MTELPHQTINQQVLAERIADFTSSYTYGGALLEYLRRDEVRVVRVERGRRGRWALYTVLPRRLQEMFDVDHEVLCIATAYSRLEPRVLAELQNALRDEARVDNELAVLVSADPDASKLAAQRAGETAILSLTGEALSDPQRSFRVDLARMLLTIDHFNVTRPIREPSAFFGRHQDLADVRQSLEQGQHVGIFGLRKAGKSSLLNRVQALLEESGWIVGAIDLNEFQSEPDELPGAVIASISHALTVTGRRFPRIGGGGWISRLDRVVARAGGSKGVVLIVDEIDVALPDRVPGLADSGSEPASLLRTLSELRGYVQRLQMRGQDHPVLLAAGVDPAVFERSRLFGSPNPLYQFAKLKFLGPLEREELQQMIRTLGKRTGMRFRSHELIDSIQDEYGGHPLLSRQACSFVHQNRPKDVVPYHVEAEDLDSAFSARGPNTPLSHALDVPTDFAEWFPEEGAVLLDGLTALAWDKLRNLDHAIAYGIVGRDGQPRMNALVRGRALLARAS